MEYFHKFFFKKCFIDIRYGRNLRKWSWRSTPHFKYEDTETQVVQIHLEAEQGPELSHSDSFSCSTMEDLTWWKFRVSKIIYSYFKLLLRLLLVYMHLNTSETISISKAFNPVLEGERLWYNLIFKVWTKNIQNLSQNMSFIYLFTKEIFVEYLLYACADTVLRVGNTEMNVMDKALVLMDSWEDKRGQVKMYIFYKVIISQEEK